ncbi:MAG: type II toxin-antitoxin system VapC family toxin, partial [Gammaproteobacteria bacterium]
MIVLDTHALVWWVNEDGKLSARARREITGEQRGARQILVSAITAWEIAMLLKKGRLRLTMEFDEWLSAVA